MMAPSPGEFSEQQSQQHKNVQTPGVGYIPTEDERRTFRECNSESFWYRSLPVSAVSMILTQGLISRGLLTSSSRFGSLPKVAFAGFCGYIAGKISYMKTCQEKFKKLENSPLGDAIRQGYRPSQVSPRGNEFSEENVSASPVRSSSPFAPQFSSSPYSSKLNPANAPFSSSMSESQVTGITDVVTEPDPYIEETQKSKPMTYDELRNKNRETYEMALTQRADSSVRSSPDRKPRKEVKTNKYGDAWEE
ncbi:OCIA domain-containing protein 1 [Bombina bombina]|uniref:OCIA domain-containing protein 1 n=1 Tax=Bombina bombina TaxID=8345 RepID=UPI00235AC55B|nr:OCIA domain-containing protein 1 [Bombina bombina]